MPRKPEWSGDDSVVRNARRVLPQLAERFFQQGRLALKRGSTPALHKFRLTSKHFRYTLELFQPIYGPGLEQRLEALRLLQRHLGEVNDCSTTRQLLDGYAKASRTVAIQGKRVLPVLARSQTQAVLDLRHYWHTTFEKSGELERWTDYLRQYPGRKPPRQRRK